MATFKEKLTTKGEQLLAKSLSGEANVTFTKIEMGDGEVSAALQKNLNAVVHPVVTLDIDSVVKSPDNVINIKGVFTNENLTNGFYFREKGIYATDGTTEILFMYGNNGSLSEWINAPGDSVIEKVISSIITFSESDQINATLQSGVYAMQSDLDDINNDLIRLDTAVDGVVTELQEINSSVVSKSSTNGNILINDVETTVYQHPGSGTNPHGTTKTDIGLGNVTNESKTTMFTNPTFTGTAKATANTNYTTSQVRNASFGTIVPTALTNGEVYFMYE